MEMEGEGEGEGETPSFRCLTFQVGPLLEDKGGPRFFMLCSCLFHLWRAYSSPQDPRKTNNPINRCRGCRRG